MTGRDVALATLHREDVSLPCMTNFLSLIHI